MASPLRFTALASLSAALFGAALVPAACSATGDENTFETGSGAGSTTGPATSGAGGSGGEVLFDGGTGSGGGIQGGGVPKTCAEAIEAQSYIGCEYWPTVTSNAGLYDSFEFAVVAANPTETDAVVTVSRGGGMITQVTVPPGQIQTVPLPWVQELKQDDPAGDGTGMTSILLADGAYQVTSSVPIILYQFNPLEFQLSSTPFDCPQADILGGCFSFTNDASLVLPKTALRGEYYVMSYPSLHIGIAGVQWLSLPGFVAITATEDGTSVTVESTSHVRSGPGVAALAPGGTGTYAMNAGDVLMLDTGVQPATSTPLPGKPCEVDASGFTLCPTGSDYDLTGTHIVATKPVSVIGGHDCTFVPYNRFACDHIEESLFPVDTLGQDLIVTAPRAVSSIGGNPPGTPDTMFLRVLSAADANVITFDPPVSAPITLNKGQWQEIGPIAQDVRIKAGNKILVGQYMVGENYAGVSAGAGDPALSIAIPTEQYRLEYAFLAPASYTNNFVNVVAPPNATISIDGVTIGSDEFVPVGSSGLSVARHEIAGGAHTMKGDMNFGIVVYGYGSYTSYMYPGGLNLETITIIPD